MNAMNAMNAVKKHLALLAGFSLAGVAAAAAQTAPPADLEASARDYLQSRMYDPDRARFRSSTDAYRAQGVLRTETGKRVQWSGWATDMQAKAPLPHGGTSSYQGYTVAYQNGRPVALSRDFESFKKDRDSEK